MRDIKDGREAGLGQPAGLLYGLHLVRNHGEVVGPDASQPARTPAGGLESVTDLPQQVVARLPAERIVDGLEPLHVNIEHSQSALRCARGEQLLADALEEQAAVRQTRKRVVIRQVVELFGLLDVVERKRDVAGKLPQQLHLLLVEKPDLAGV